MSRNKLEQLKAMTTIVADTGDIASIGTVSQKRGRRPVRSIGSFIRATLQAARGKGRGQRVSRIRGRPGFWRAVSVKPARAKTEVEPT